MNPEEEKTGTTEPKSFEHAARPLIEWLNENGHPHNTIIVTTTSAELLEGVKSTGEVLDYLKD